MKRLMILPLAVFVFACDKPADKKDDTTTTAASATATPATTATTTTATTAAAAPAPADIAEADLVTAADLQDDAEKSITKKNYKTELASLETEMSKD
jgi:hypothetical protein